MKIKTEQLARTLKADAHPVYWLSGDEPFLLQEAADQVRGITATPVLPTEKSTPSKRISTGSGSDSLPAISLFLLNVKS